MNLILNGESTDLPAALTVAELLQNQGRNPQLVAVEVNRKLVPRSRHDQVSLSDGDEVEIVTLAGGG
jgi:sulfur carrier protein